MLPQFLSGRSELDSVCLGPPGSLPEKAGGPTPFYQ